jgi:hypothetical protein
MPTVIQPSFNSGEWAPHLYARVDLAKFRQGAKTLRNFFVDYRGGASTRVGTKYLLKGYKDTHAIRMIPFQSSFELGFALEFGDAYVRFYQNGAPVLETGLNITGATKAATCQLTVANTYTTGDVDWIYVSGVSGMTQLNGRYFIVHARTAGTVDLYDLFGNPVNSTGYSTYTAGGTTERVYTLASPYAATDLALLKFTQNGNVLIICHPDYSPRTLTATTATSWAFAVITFGSSAGIPTGITVTSTRGANNVYYSYKVTSVDSNGEESDTSAAGSLNGTDLRSNTGTNTISWSAVTGAVSYNVYKSQVSYTNPVPTGISYGFIGNVTSTSMIDSNIAEDYSQPPPVAQNPFGTGSTISSVNIGTPGSYTPALTLTVTFSAPGGGGVTATGNPTLGALSVVPAAGGAGYVVGDTIDLADSIVLQVLTVTAGAVTTASVINVGSVTSTLPANPLAQVATSGAGAGATFTVTWKVIGVTMVLNGSGYTSPPSVTFSSGAATGTAVLGATGVGNPAVPAFFQQRLVLAAPDSNPQTLYFSRPGWYFNYDTSTPSQDDDAITAPLVSGQLNNIHAMIPQPGGLIVLADGSSFLINGGSLGAAVTPASITSNSQSFVGANDIPPIVANFDVLFVKSKGTGVQDSTYNFYTNVFAGTDISVIASHLFYGYELLEWCWAEEPFKTVQAVRNDGTLLTLTFIKEQEFVAWTHSDTDGSFNSVCTIVETATIGFQNYVYAVIERTIGATVVQYIEMFTERIFTNGVTDAWTVDSGLQYSGAPATTFSGAEHLAGKTCTGLADGVAITPFTMPANGVFTLASASKVTVGLGFTCDLQTLYLDTGDPTIQSKMKKIGPETLRVTDTLGLKIGTDFDNLVTMKDLVVGNVGSITNERVTDLVTGDVRTYIDPKWQEEGTICIRQDQPYPATILAVIPQLSVGDSEEKGART